ncbi:hypothetical protein C8F01DRAFT_1266484 [Mycena amicta]|nr:hypothetical protein C8F01DRAFT_1266484 [Mycena amicta]
MQRLRQSQSFLTASPPEGYSEWILAAYTRGTPLAVSGPLPLLAYSKRRFVSSASRAMQSQGLKLVALAASSSPTRQYYAAESSSNTHTHTFRVPHQIASIRISAILSPLSSIFLFTELFLDSRALSHLGLTNTLPGLQSRSARLPSSFDFNPPPPSLALTTLPCQCSCRCTPGISAAGSHPISSLFDISLFDISLFDIFTFTTGGVDASSYQPAHR